MVQSPKKPTEFCRVIKSATLFNREFAALPQTVLANNEGLLLQGSFFKQIEQPGVFSRIILTKPISAKTRSQKSRPHLPTCVIFALQKSDLDNNDSFPLAYDLKIIFFYIVDYFAPVTTFDEIQSVSEDTGESLNKVIFDSPSFYQTTSLPCIDHDGMKVLCSWTTLKN